MARKPRFNLIDVPQHVVQRGNNKQACFYSEKDYRFYLKCLAKYSEKYHCLIHAFVLMGNHVHLLVTPQKTFSVSHMMQAIGAKYVPYFNNTHERTGTLWEGRFKSNLVDTNHYLLACMRYIELNPVRAGMVTTPNEYLWSSYQTNACAKKTSLITPHPTYLALSSDKIARHANYLQLFSDALGYKQLHNIRESLNRGLVLGSDQFKERIETMTNRPVTPGKAGRPAVKEGRGFYYLY